MVYSSKVSSKDEPQVALGVGLPVLAGIKIEEHQHHHFQRQDLTASYSLDELAGPVLCEFTETSI